MPKPTPTETCEQVKAAVAGGRSHRATAAEFRMCRTTVAAILQKSRLPVYPTVDFRRVRRYWCRGCSAWVQDQPCPACIARTAPQRKHGDEKRRVDHRVFPPRGYATVAVPEAFVAWIRRVAKRMIGRAGHLDDETEARETITANLAELIAETVGTVARERREKAELRLKKTGVGAQNEKS